MTDRGPRGFIYAATGAAYAALAGQSARTLRAAMPGAAIDLFTDQTAPPDVFDRVHPVAHAGHRPKFEALARSRFDRTIYLDCDTLVLAPLDDVFDLLDRFDLAAAYDQGMNTQHCTRIWRRPVPTAFPQLNTGVIGVRTSEATERLLMDCDRVFQAEGHKIDQAVFRELVYDSDLRLATLPEAYNLMYFHHLEAQTNSALAPRVLHLPRLHHHVKNGGRPYVRPEEIVGPAIWRHIQAMLKADRGLGQRKRIKITRLIDQGPFGQIRRFTHNLRRDLARLRRG